jgi:hypothetical protein
MRRSPRPALTLVLLLAATSGCNTWYNDVPSPDTLLAQVPWFDHMIASRAVWPYSRLGIPRNTPPGTVTRSITPSAPCAMAWLGPGMAPWGPRWRPHPC